MVVTLTLGRNDPAVRADVRQTAATDSTQVLAIDDVLRARSLTVSPVAIAPTGDWVAYTVVTAVGGSHKPPSAGNRYFAANGRSTLVDHAELWVTNVKSGQSLNLTNPRGVSWGGTWSPDGRWLAFLSDRAGAPQLWLWDVKSRRSHRVSEAVVHTAYASEGPRWIPDGRRIVVTLACDDSGAVGTGTAKKLTEVAGASAIVRVYDRTRDGNDEYSNRALARVFMADLGVIDTRTGKVRRVVRASAIPNFAVSPDGRTIAYAVLRGMQSYQSQDALLDLDILNLAAGVSRVLAHNLIGNELGHFSWSPTGAALAYIATTYGKDNPQDAFVIPLNGTPPITVTPGVHPRFGDFERGPLWARDGRSLYLVGGDTIWEAASDGAGFKAIGSLPGHQLHSIIAGAFSGVPWRSPGESALYVSIRDVATGQVGVGRLDLANGHMRPIFEENIAGLFHWTDAYGIDVAGGRVVFPLERADAPRDLWIADNGFVMRRRLTHLNPYLDRYAFGTTRRIQWLSLDGESLRGVVLLPSPFVEGRHYPTIVWVYGGERSDGDLNRFGLEPLEYNMQVFSTRGYAVLIPDAPQHLGTPMVDIAKTVLPGVNKLVELGIADSTRIGVGGYSYGGYSTLALITTTPRFRAAVTVAGTGANLLSEYTLLTEDGYSWGTGWAENGQGLMGASPWERRDRYIENSPFFYLDRVTTPLLLIHGGRDDPVVSRETFVALRRLGNDVAYAEYPDVRHAFVDASLEQQRDYYTRVLTWFDRYLRGIIAPARDSGR
jgi:dipeptidyl aminopeptidase/acylaminoacyl peptidase